jgi:hypothetical protein
MKNPEICGDAGGVIAMVVEVEDDGKPSLRYIRLLRDGARAHRLPEYYIRFLESVDRSR